MAQPMDKIDQIASRYKLKILNLKLSRKYFRNDFALNCQDN
jgi:hypothetical protein